MLDRIPLCRMDCHGSCRRDAIRGGGSGGGVSGLSHWRRSRRLDHRRDNEGRNGARGEANDGRDARHGDARHGRSHAGVRRVARDGRSHAHARLGNLRRQCLLQAAFRHLLISRRLRRHLQEGAQGLDGKIRPGLRVRRKAVR